ncbi:MAG: hypothetical protein COV99_02835 [Bacteroidetes bacterium CG12_big_fil_rev_8_21_14_0_65_60_17]|nr:MAG: hypothetical protein COV99_02835 [Bacteroidetes bacterium CG12_big_fil_rev_8_21_14_0_65_60_17]
MACIIMKYVTATLLITALLMSGPSTDAWAQDTFKVTIENGRLFINGKPVPKSELPESLDMSSISGTLNIWSDENELIEIGNLPFRIENDRLVRADTSRIRSGRVTVFFADEKGQAGVRVFRTENMEEVGRGSESLEMLVDKLRFQAQEMDSMRIRLETGPRRERDILARQLVAEAENAAFLARALPDAQLAEYMATIELADRHLYEELRREHRLESESRQLAHRIRLETMEENRAALTKQLESTLHQIFDLKQENRQREIEQLAERLESLRKTLAEREKQRDLLVEKRLEELLNEKSAFFFSKQDKDGNE